MWYVYAGEPDAITLGILHDPDYFLGGFQTLRKSLEVDDLIEFEVLSHVTKLTAVLAQREKGLTVYKLHVHTSVLNDLVNVHYKWVNVADVADVVDEWDEIYRIPITLKRLEILVSLACAELGLSNLEQVKWDVESSYGGIMLNVKVADGASAIKALSLNNLFRACIERLRPAHFTKALIQDKIRNELHRQNIRQGFHSSDLIISPWFSSSKDAFDELLVKIKERQ